MVMFQVLNQQVMILMGTYNNLIKAEHNIMSRSIHKTVKGVFGNKSRSQINKMINEDDPDVEELAQKSFYKKDQKNKRKIEKFHQEINNED